MKPIVSVIEWFGPYTQEEARTASFDYEDGIYLALGKAKRERSRRLQYVGLASNLPTRINGYHHKLPLITHDLKIWLGEVVSPRTPGKKIKVTDRMLDLSEWAHSYFLQLPLNDKKKECPPDRPITVYNRWWRKEDYETPCKKRPHRAWPDIIDYVGPGYQAKLIWFGQKQVVKDVWAFKN